MYEIDNQKFGAFLLQLRREHGMTQKDLAERLFVSDKAVSKWERGLSLPDIALLQPIADTLDVTVTELLAGRFIREGQSLNIGDVEPIVRKSLCLTAQEQTEQSRRRRWKSAFLASCLCDVVGMAVLLLILKFQSVGPTLILPPLLAEWPALCWILQTILEKVLPGQAGATVLLLVLLTAIAGGLSIPVYVVGRKYE